MAVDLSSYEEAIDIIFTKGGLYDRIIEETNADIDKRGLNNEVALQFITQARTNMFDATLAFTAQAISNYKSDETREAEERLAVALARKAEAEAQLLEDEAERKVDADAIMSEKAKQAFLQTQIKEEQLCIENAICELRTAEVSRIPIDDMIKDEEAEQMEIKTDLLQKELDRSDDLDKEAEARAEEALYRAKLSLENRDLIRHQKSLVTREIAGYDAEVALKVMAEAGGNVRFAMQSDMDGLQEQIDNYNDTQAYASTFSEFGNDIEDYAEEL